MNDEVNWFLGGLLVGIIFVFGVYALVPNSSPNLYNKAISECEKELPRNQRCKIIGIVDLEKTDDQQN